MQSAEHVSIERQLTFKPNSQDTSKSIYDRDFERFAQEYGQKVQRAKIELVSPTTPIEDYDFSRFESRPTKIEPINPARPIKVPKKGEHKAKLRKRTMENSNT